MYILLFFLELIYHKLLLDYLLIDRKNVTTLENCKLKARLHRRFLSQQLDAIFVALKVATSKSHV